MRMDNPLREPRAEDLSERVTQLAADMPSLAWHELGHASGANNITIPTTIWASAHEFLIEWKLGSDAPWGCLPVPKHAFRTRYTDAYYYSADYYANVDFGVGPSGGETYISPTTGWIIGKYGNTDLAVSNLIYYVYWR